MYINKNKGATLLELIVIFFLSTVIFQVLNIYFKYLNIENRRVFIDIQTKLDSDIILKKIQSSFHEASSYKIYEYLNIPRFIDYSKESLKEGNMLVIERYIPFQDETEVEIYYQTSSNYIVSHYASKKSDNIIRELKGGEVILRRMTIRFYLEEFGVTLEGFYFKKEYRKELKE